MTTMAKRKIFAAMLQEKARPDNDVEFTASSR